MSVVNLGRVLTPLVGIACWLAVAVITASPLGAETNRQGSHTVALPTSIEPQEWAAFVARYVDGNGRVIDIEQNAISHSEGQSYGMLLAVMADDRAVFDSILHFTFMNMRHRRDALVSWSYDPREMEPITDPNNATDADILIAYALLAAADKWQEPRYKSLADPMIADIGRLLLDASGELVLVRPAAFGFDRSAHQDGPVVNLSYYVYGALLAFADIDDRYPFFRAWQSGLLMTERAVAVSGGYAPDWISMRSDRAGLPAQDFKAKSSYDAVRIPLYMMLGGQVPTRYLKPFDRAWNIAGNMAPVEFDLSAGRRIMDMRDSGYRAIAALTACAVRDQPLPADLLSFRPSTYFSSALHLLSLATARTYYPQCLPTHDSRQPETAPGNGDNSTPRSAFALQPPASSQRLVRNVSARPAAASGSFFRMR